VSQPRLVFSINKRLTLHDRQLRGILLDHRSHGNIEADILSGRTDGKDYNKDSLRSLLDKSYQQPRPFRPSDHLKDVPGNLKEENPDVEENRRPQRWHNRPAPL
jgi:hypothetical protein